MCEHLKKCKLMCGLTSVDSVDVMQFNKFVTNDSISVMTARKANSFYMQIRSKTAIQLISPSWHK